MSAINSKSIGGVVDASLFRLPGRTTAWAPLKTAAAAVLKKRVAAKGPRIAPTISVKAKKYRSMIYDSILFKKLILDEAKHSWLSKSLSDG